MGSVSINDIYPLRTQACTPGLDIVSCATRAMSCNISGLCARQVANTVAVTTLCLTLCLLLLYVGHGVVKAVTRASTMFHVESEAMRPRDEWARAKPSKTLIMYVFSNSDDLYSDNLRFFVEHGVVDDTRYSFWIIVNQLEDQLVRLHLKLALGICIAVVALVASTQSDCLAPMSI